MPSRKPPGWLKFWSGSFCHTGLSVWLSNWTHTWWSRANLGLCPDSATREHSSFCVSVSSSVKWWKQFSFLEMPRVSDLWELVWKRPSTGQMVNKRYPFRILLSNPSLLLHYKMQQLHPQQTAPSQRVLSGRSSTSTLHGVIQPADFQEPSEFSHNHPNSSACNQHHNVISHFSFHQNLCS